MFKLFSGIKPKKRRVAVILKRRQQASVHSDGILLSRYLSRVDYCARFMTSQSVGLNSPCIKCSESDFESHVVCLLCKQACHIKCNKISKSVFTYCSKNSLAELGFKWVCDVCTKEVESQGAVNAVTTKNELKELKDDLQNIKKTI